MSRPLTTEERAVVASHIAKLEATTAALLAETDKSAEMRDLIARYRLTISEAKRELRRAEQATEAARALEVEREKLKMSTDALRADLDRQRRLALSDEAAKTGSIALANVHRETTS